MYSNQCIILIDGVKRSEEMEIDQYQEIYPIKTQSVWATQYS